MNLHEATQIYNEMRDTNMSAEGIRMHDALGWALEQLTPKTYYYAHYGFTSDAAHDAQDPSLRLPYVSGHTEMIPVSDDGDIECTDCWPDSGPFTNEVDAIRKALEIEKREFRTSW